MADKESMSRGFIAAEGKRMGEFSGVKKISGTRYEFIAVILIVVLVWGALMFGYRTFVSGAHETSAASTAHYMYLALYSSMSLDQSKFTREDYDEFRRKYADFTPATELASGTNPIEKSVVSRLGNAGSWQQQVADGYTGTGAAFGLKGYVKIEFAGDEDFVVYYSDNKDGKNAARFPK